MMHFVHNLKLSVVGKCAKMPQGQIFCKSDISLHCAMTVKKEFTLGRDGILKITLNNYQMFDTKNGLLLTMKDAGHSIDDYREDCTWLRLCEDKGYKFTDALMNNIYKKTASTKIWIYNEWYLQDVASGESIDVAAVQPKNKHMQTSIVCGLQFSVWPHEIDQDYVCLPCINSNPLLTKEGLITIAKY